GAGTAVGHTGRWCATLGGGRAGGTLRAARTMAVTSAAGLGRPHRWLAGLAWGLWAVAILGLGAGLWMDPLLRRTGYGELAFLLSSGDVSTLLAAVSAATVGALVASR